MNCKIGRISSIINMVAVVGFALCIVLGSNYGSYLVCMFISFSFVPMMAAFCSYCKDETKVAGYSAMIFGGIYSVFILAVYFAQVTSVVNDDLNNSALQILDYQKFGLLFNYDLLGYGIMALATFFIGLTIEGRTKADQWLKWLLLIHGIFFLACLTIPMLGLFNNDMVGGEWIGKMVLFFWCVYFTPIGLLSYIYFNKKSIE